MIEITNLNKSFGDKEIFKNYNLSISDNEFVAITGASGAGKTTLLNIIGAIEKFESGEVIVDSKNIKRLSNREKLYYLRETVSFLFQNYALMDNKTVYENITFNKYDKSRLVEVNRLIEKLNLKDMSSKIVSSLSGGEQQRVALARIILKPSKLILADEPTGNLDAENSRMVLNELKGLQRTGKTVVVVTHDLSSLSLFDRVIYLK